MTLEPRHWLLKSEPSVFSIDHLRDRGRDHWDGVRNYQARNFMLEMKVGDLCLFYHSNADPTGVAGVARVAREAHPDFTARDPGSRYYDPKASEENPIWQMVDVEFVEKLPRVVTLAELKAEPGLEAMEVTRKGSRLSVQPVKPEEFATVLAMARRAEPSPPERPRRPEPARKARPARSAPPKAARPGSRAESAKAKGPGESPRGRPGGRQAEERKKR